MTDISVIPMIEYDRLPYVFLPLEGQGDDVIELVCSAEDFHWRLDPQTVGEQWPEVLAAMRDHQQSHG